MTEGDGEIVEYKFSKGDEVPQWVERIEPSGTDLRMTFCCDVVVERTSGGTTVYPVRELAEDECIMRLDGKHKGAWITGGPTMVFMYPRGDLRNSAPILRTSGASPGP